MPAVPNVPATLSCPCTPQDYTLTATGTGFGRDKQSALSAARADADAQLDIGLSCGDGCTLVEVEVDPTWDDGRPTYTAHGRGQRCVVTRSRVVTASCEELESSADVQQRV